nr:hypothetical protein [Clostridia bacterium]
MEHNDERDMLMTGKGEKTFVKESTMHVVQDRLSSFVEEHHQQPLYAEADIRWKDTGEEYTYLFKLSGDIDERTDGEIFFNCNGMEEFMSLLQKDNGEDFTVNPESVVFYDKSIFTEESQTVEAEAGKQLDGYARQMPILKERTAEVHDLINRTGLQYSPLTPRLPVIASFDDGDGDGRKLIAHVMVTDHDIILFSDRYDAYDDRNGMSISELQDHDQEKVLDTLMEHLGDQDRQLSVHQGMEMVPVYALPAILNGDFSSIEDRKDIMNIESFVKAHQGHVFSHRGADNITFSTSPAFGLPADCMPVDCFKIATVKELCKEQETRKRVSDIAIFSVKGGGMNIKASIDGKRMMSKPLDRKDVSALTEGTDRISLASKYYAKELENNREKNHSIKR